jgi:PKD repeat protein
VPKILFIVLQMLLTVVNMIGKMAKITVYVLAMIFFSSTIMPAVISQDFVQTVSETEPLFGFEQRASDGKLDPFAIPEGPKVSIVVEKENGDEITMEVPEDIDKEALEEIIEEELEDLSIQDAEDMEEESTLEEEAISEADETLHVAMHTRDYWYFQKGYFFCEIGQEIQLDASDIYNYNTIMKYEWDFNGDGTYDFISPMPTVYHSYKELGLYVLRVKITYSYNYTYRYSNPIEGDDYLFFGDFDPVEPSMTTVTKVKSIKYEARVSAGSEEDSYPPILDFHFRVKEEPEPMVIDDIDSQEQNISLPSVQLAPKITFPGVPIIGPPIIYDPPTIYPVPIRVPIQDQVYYYNQSKTHVQMVPVTDDITIAHIPDCVVEFDASTTINFQGESEFIWDFGDGSWGEGEVVSHTYKRKGTYTATLRAKGWQFEHTATFTTLRGYGEPKVAFLSSGYGSIGEDYLFCRLGDTLNFDITSIVSGWNLAWVEWDFDCDGVYEENTTSAKILKTFEEAGYYEVPVRYTYYYEAYPYIYYGGMSDPYSDNINQKLITYHNTNEYVIKVAVANEENIFPPIPYFYVKSSSTFSWWTSTIDYQDGLDGITLKNATYLRTFSDSEIQLNSWNSSIDFNANSTFDLNSPKLDSFTYHWDFGDGTSGSGIEVTHIYANSNIDYDVRLTVSNGLFESSSLRTIRPRPYSPNIYLYREKPGSDTVRVIVDGTVTKTVPEIELGSEITWENVWIEDGKLYYEGKEYDFLYYEELIDPKPSNFGWILERDETGSLHLNDEKMTLNELKEFFRKEMKKTGLYDNEIEDFVEEWLGAGGRLFPGETVFRYAIMYVPENIVDEIIQIETEREYDEIIRVHFLVQPAGENLVLESPQYPEHKKGENVLHEWGVFTDSTIVGEEEDSKEVSSGLSDNIPLGLLADAQEIYSPPRTSYLYLNEKQVVHLLFDTPKKMQFVYPA